MQSVLDADFVNNSVPKRSVDTDTTRMHQSKLAKNIALWGD
jgi:hypothetical protein